MTLESAITRYLSTCRSSGKTPDTLASYEATLRSLQSYLASSERVTELEQVVTAHLDGYKTFRSATASATSLRLYMTHISGFFTYCVDMDMIAKNPFKKSVLSVDAASIRREESDEYDHILTETDFRRVALSSRPATCSAKVLPRNRFLLLLLITTGLRNQSVAALRFGDIDRAAGTIRVPSAKGGKHGQAPLTGITAMALDEYVASLPSVPADSDYLFTTSTGKPWSRQQLSNTVEQVVRDFTGVEGFRSHAMRHTCATLLSGRGMKDKDISLLFFHSDGEGAAVTSRYIRRDYTALFAEVNEIFTTILAENPSAVPHTDCQASA